MRDTEQTSLLVSYLPHSLQQCIRDVENATSHQMVGEAVKQLAAILAASSYLIQHMKILAETNWKQAIQR